jgi:hypothetical protein
MQTVGARSCCIKPLGACSTAHRSLQRHRSRQAADAGPNDEGGAVSRHA